MVYRKRFSKQEIYEVGRMLGARTWQEAWHSVLGDALVFVLGQEFVNVIVLSQEGGIPQNQYIKKEDKFVKLDWEELRGEGYPVCKVRLPIYHSAKLADRGITGTVYRKLQKVREVGYTLRRWEVFWEGKKTKMEVELHSDFVWVYGNQWERVAEELERRRKEKERERFIEEGRKWAKDRGITDLVEEIYEIVGMGVVEEKKMREREEREELMRHVWGGSYEERDMEYDYVFYVLPDSYSFSFKTREKFLYAWLSALFHNDPGLLLDYIEIS